MTMKQSVQMIGIAALAAAVWTVLADGDRSPEQARLQRHLGRRHRPTDADHLQAERSMLRRRINSSGSRAGGAKGGLKWITFEQDCSIQNRGPGEQAACTSRSSGRRSA